MHHIVKHDISQGRPACWFAHKSNPQHAIAWLLPADANEFCVTGRDGQFFGGFLIVEDAEICAYLVANSQPVQLRVAA